MREILLKSLISDSGKIKPKKCNIAYLKSIKCYDYLLDKTKFDDTLTIGERVLVIKNNILSHGKCLECGKNTKFDRRSDTLYRDFCSLKCSNKSNRTKNKYKKTCILKYGVENTSFIGLPIDKLSDKELLVRLHHELKTPIYVIANELGVNNVTLSNAFNRLNIEIKKFPTRIRWDGLKSKHKDKLNDVNFLKNEYETKHISTIAKELDVSNNFLHILFNEYGIEKKYKKSKVETEIEEFLKTHNIKYISNSKNIISPLELDLYLPEYNIAIEYNGLYWHCDKFKDKSYHLDKTDKCNEVGIQLLHIFETEWGDTWKSVILNKCNKSFRIYARKCEIVEVDSKTSREFLTKNHLQGTCNASKIYGLMYEDELVSCISFGKSRYNKNIDWELIRYCNKLNTSVVGGFSRLLKHFTRNETGSIISYANKRWSNGNLYDVNGFKLRGESLPNYFYFKGEILESRLKFQKHKLKDVLSVFDENKTEYENMSINNYKRIFDCGNYIYVLQ